MGYKITTRKTRLEDESSWAVLVNGKPLAYDLRRDEVPHWVMVARALCGRYKTWVE